MRGADAAGHGLAENAMTNLLHTKLESTVPEDATAPEHSTEDWRGPHSLPAPEGVAKDRILWTYALGIAGVHLLSLLAFVPWLFSWTGVACWLFAGLYVFRHARVSISATIAC